MTRDWTNATDDEILAADLIIELGLDSLPPEQQQQAADRFTSTCQEGILAELFVSLPTDQRPALQAIIDMNDQQQLLDFLTQNVPDIEEKSQAELIRFKRTMLVV